MVAQQTNIRWGLIFALALLGLTRPQTAAEHGRPLRGPGGEPAGPVLATALIAALWVGVVVIVRVPNPLATLALAGAFYGLFAIVLQQLGWILVLGGAPEVARGWSPVLVMSWGRAS